MGELVAVEFMVKPETAAALKDRHRHAAVERLIDNMVNGGRDDPLVAVMHAISSEAVAAGLTPEEVEAELAVYNSERRGRGLLSST